MKLLPLTVPKKPPGAGGYLWRTSRTIGNWENCLMLSSNFPGYPVSGFLTACKIE
jgi:hypothetical protein